MKQVVAILISLLSLQAYAAGADGKWLFHKDSSDSLQRALNITGSSFNSLVATPEGVAYETGWWTENPGVDGKTSVIVRYGDNPPDTIEYKMQGSNMGLIWIEGVLWGSMNRMNCDLSMQYRDKSDPAPAGCAWLHIRGWGYSGLDGECLYNPDWEENPGDGPMECLIEAPAKFVE